MRAVPLLDSLHTFSQSLQTQTSTSGKLGEALAYLHKQWTKLIRYVDDGRLAIDTNLAENAIRPFARGRRAWLFADTVKGAKASAAFFSLVETAKANGLEPYAYLCRLFERLPQDGAAFVLPRGSARGSTAHILRAPGRSYN